MAFDAGAIKSRMVLDKSQWDKSTKEIRVSQQKMSAQTKKTTAAMKGMWKQMVVGIGVTTLITSGIRGMIRQMSDTVKVGRTFEREWANVTTMLDISRTATEQMKEELKALSPTLGDTADLAKGMYQVLSASIEPAKAIRFLGVAAKSAKAGVTDTKTAVDALTTVINAYGLEAEAATEISDIMFGTVKRGKLTYGELAQALGTVVPVAATVGIEFKEVAAAVATLTRQGVVASKATMQLRQVMMAILKPSAEAAEVAEELGIELGSMALKSKGLSGFLFDLKEKTKGNADLMAKLVPNVRALTAVMALAGKASEGYAFDQEFLNDTMEFTDEAFRKQMESVDAWIDVFEVAADKIKIAIFEGLTSQLRESIRTAEDFDEKVTQATNNTANKVSLHVSGMVKILADLRAAFIRQQAPVLMWMEIISGSTKRVSELAEAEKFLGVSLALLHAKTWVATEEGIKPLSEAISEAVNNVIQLRDNLEGLYEFEGIWNALMPPSELMERWEEFYNLVETPELDLIWEQQMQNMEQDTLDFMAKIIPGMAFMTKKITKDTEDGVKTVKLTTTDMAMAVGSVLSDVAGQSKGLAIAGAIISTYAGAAKSLQMYGMPLAIPFIAMALAAGFKQVAAIKAQDIPSAAEGAFLTTPTVIEAGHGPMGEIISPVPMMKEVFKETILETGGGATIHLNFNAPIISATELSDRNMDEAAEYLLFKVREEIERYGGKLNA